MSNRKIVILEMLNKADGPISASDMARQFNVSRQSIVGDIALLRASGTDITATSRGYVLTEKMFEDHIYVGTLVCDTETIVWKRNCIRLLTWGEW